MNDLLVTFKALADETRLRLLGILLEGPFNVNELVGILEMGQSRVSRHLKILLDAGLVQARREGSWVYYGLDEQGIGARTPENGLEFLPSLIESLRRYRDTDLQSIKGCLEKRRQRAEQFFSDVAPTWDEQRDRVQGPSEYIDRLIDLLDHAQVLVDLGTGTGVLLAKLSPRAQRVIGVDASSEMLRVARENAAESGFENVELRLGALEHLPLPDGEADAMVANMVLHHVAQPVEALGEACRGLQPGGKLIIADFMPHAEEVYREKLGDLWLGFDESELTRWLRDAGLELQHFEIVPAEGNRPAVFLARAEKTGAAQHTGEVTTTAARE